MDVSQASSVVYVLSLFDTGVGVIRSLGRAGIPVVGLDSNPVMPGFKSHYCKSILSPDPVHQPEALLAFLMEEGEKLDHPGILMPTSDAYVMFISRYREELCKLFMFVLPPDTILDALVNKRRQYELAERCGIPLAKTFYPETPDDVHLLKEDLEYPVFIKPYFGHLWREVYGSAHKGFQVGSPRELADRYQEIFGFGLQAMVQSIIEGPDSNLYEVSFYIGKRGDMQAVFTHRKLHQYPPHFGVCTCAESVDYPELVDLGMKLMQGFEYRGASSTEFKRDERDGRLKLIELNPRFAQQNILAADCGINFPLVQYLDMLDIPHQPVTTFRIGRKWLDPVIDLPSFWQYFRHHEVKILEWLKSWKGVRSFPVLAVDDLGPFFKKYEYGKKFATIPSYLVRHWKQDI